MISHNIARGCIMIGLVLAIVGWLRPQPAAGQRFTVTLAATSRSGSVVGGGGGYSSGGAFALHGTIGQAVAGVASGGHYTLHAGFWIDGGRWPVYVPLVRR